MKKVIGIGETVFDIIFRNEMPVSAVPGGSTFNSMISLGRCGISAAFLSETGDDRIGRNVCAYLEENGVSSADVDKNGKSHLSLAFLNEKNDAEYVFYKDHPHDKAEMRFPEITPGDIVLFGSYYAINPVIRHKVKALLEYAKKNGAIIYYDLNFRASHQDEVDILLPNIEENISFADIVRGSNEDFDIVYGLKSFDEIYEKVFSGKGNLIYTCGAEPVMFRGNNGTKLSLPVPPIETISTIGAGDNFNAGAICAIYKGGITKDMISLGLDEAQWHDILTTAQKFSSECCRSIENSVSMDFAEKIRHQTKV